MKKKALRAVFKTALALMLMGSMSIPAWAYTADQDILVKKMQENLKPGQITYATLYDIDKVNKSDLQYVAKDMTAKRGKVLFEFCTLKEKEVVARMVVNPNLVKEGDGVFDPYIALEGEDVQLVKDKFTKILGKEVKVIACGEVDFGMPVVISAKLNYKNTDKKALTAYSYNAADNTYNIIKDIEFSVDEAGFIHFQTNKAGYIIVTKS